MTLQKKESSASGDPKNEAAYEAYTKGRYFLMADNRTGDPCIWRPVPRASIVGRVISTYWPPSRIALH